MNTFKELLSFVDKLLKEHKFKKKGNTFYLQKDNNWGLINFQTSRTAPVNSTTFTINLGVYSTAIGKMMEDATLATPDIEKCHWQARVGSLMPAHPDLWWTISNDSQSQKVVSEIGALIQTIILPAINQRISDNLLINEWLSGNYAGTTQYMKYAYLTTLLKLNHDNRFAFVAAEFANIAKGKPYELSALEHLKELKKYDQ